METKYALPFNYTGKNATNFVRIPGYTDEDTTYAPCGQLLEVFPGRSERTGLAAEPGDYFVCPRCSGYHFIVSVVPPVIE